MSMPEQKPGKSEQVVCTPPDFLAAVAGRLGFTKWEWDLAATEENAVAPNFFTEEDDALTCAWPVGPWCWLNPPYAKIEPWVWKACHEAECGAKIAMLVPASTGSNWWAKYVDDQAYVTFLNGRITFVGHTSPYPKDLALLLYAPFLDGGSCVWRWK